VITLLSAVDAERGGRPGASVGVGPVRAAAATAALLAARRPRAVLFVGSAGAYPPDVPIGSAFSASGLGFAELGQLGGLGYVPMPPPELTAHPALAAALGLPLASVLTLAGVTTDAPTAARLSARWTLEHMEVYAVAHACAAEGVPFAAALGVANHVGPGAHAQWLAHRGAAEAAACAAIDRLLAGPLPPDLG